MTLSSSFTMAEGQQQAFVVFRRAILEEPIEKQVEAVKMLPKVILAAGLEVAKDSIFPLLKEYIPGGDDEVLHAIAGHLDLTAAGSACAGVLGTTSDNNCWPDILEILEMLCAVEETVVRDQTVTTLIHTLEFLSNSETSTSVTPAVGRLAKDEWFTARVSACALLPHCLKRSDGEETSNALVQLFVKLAEDETPMVRRAIARVLGDFAETAMAQGDSGETLLWFIPQFKALGMEDDSASVQHIVAESASQIIALLSAEEFTTHLLHYVRWCAESPSWRIRTIIAPQFGKICAVLGNLSVCAEKLLPAFLGLLVDPERDVRAEACRGAVELHAAVGHAAFVDNVVPKLARCTGDESHVVRTAYAEACNDIISALFEGDKGASAGGAAVQDLVAKTFQLLTDDNAEVRAKVMMAVQQLTSRASESPESGLMEERFLVALQDVARDPDWRVRASFTMQLPSLAKALGQSLFQKHFYEAYIALIMDDVAAVRASTVDVIVDLSDALEESWLHKVFLKGLLDKMAGTKVRRATEFILFLNFARVLCSQDEDERLVQMLLPTVREALDYSVPNVQFCACDVLVAMAEALNPEDAITTLRPKIAALVDSSDPDVNGSAKRAMEAFKWSISDGAAPDDVAETKAAE